MQNEELIKINVQPIIIARMDSSRMPGKVLLPLLNDQSVIARIVEQIEYIKKSNAKILEPIIATSTRKKDNPICYAGETLGLRVFTGPISPLLRMCSISTTSTATWLWRINGDSPLILAPLIQHAVELLPKLDPSCVAVTNLVHRTFPYGVSLEIYRTDWLRKLANTTLSTEEKEHITPLHKKLNAEAITNITTADLMIPSFDSTVRLTIDYNDDAFFFNSLWQLNEFKMTEAGSLNRVNLAYTKRVINEI